MKSLSLFLVLLLSFTLTGCGGSSSSPASSSSSSSANTFSGTISGSSTSSQLEILLSPRLEDALSLEDENELSPKIPYIHPKALSSSVAGETVRCKTTDSDQTTYTGTIATSGAFSIEIPNSKNLKCDILKTSDTSVVKGSFVIASSDKAMNGDSMNKDSFIPSGSVNAGTVTYDPYTGKVSITESNISGSISSGSVTDPWDFTGTYTATTFSPVPNGYSALCAANAQDCHGPTEGQTFYMKRLAGLAVDGTGATTTTAKYGVMVWQSEAAFTKCGSKLGMTYASAKTNAKIDLTNSGVTEGAFDYTTSLTPSSAIKGWDNTTVILPATAATVTSGWKISTAQAGWTMQDCETVTIGTGASAVPGWKCYDTNGNSQTNLGGGCTNSSGTSVNVTDWSTVNSCTSETLTGDLAGYTKNTCTGTFNSASVTCTNTYKNSGNFNWNSVASLTTGGSTCASIGAADDKHALVQARCYADAYWRYISSVGENNLSSFCFKDLRTDWSATTANTFIISTGPEKAKTEYVLELFNFTSNTSGTFRNEESNSKGIQVRSGSADIWINCRLLNVMNMSFTRISQSPDVLLSEMIMETRLVDTKQSCWTSDARTQLGSLDSEGKSSSRSLFKLTKQ